MYTSTVGGEAQSLAYSSDGGLTWERYAGNPVVANGGRRDFRDPKVFWHEPTRRWVMVVSTGDEIGLFASPDLLRWEGSAASAAARACTRRSGSAPTCSRCRSTGTPIGCGGC